MFLISIFDLYVSVFVILIISGIMIIYGRISGWLKGINLVFYVVKYGIMNFLFMLDCLINLYVFI